MPNSIDTGAAGQGLPARSGLLPPAVRRDLADLNSQYLELGLDRGHETDPRFGWSEPVRRCLLEAEPGRRGMRMAASPFALFDLVLPAGGGADAADRGSRTAPGSRRLATGRAVACRSRSRRPSWPAPRRRPPLMRPGWRSACRRRTKRGSANSSLRSWPNWRRPAGSVRARWPRHQRFWEMLVGAARRDSAGALQWTHCVGLCLFGSDGLPNAPAPDPATGRRRTRR